MLHALSNGFTEFGIILLLVVYINRLAVCILQLDIEGLYYKHSSLQLIFVNESVGI